MKSRALVGILLSVFFLWLAIRKVDLAQFKQVLGTVEIGFLVPAFSVTILACLFRALRWKYLFRPQKEIGVAGLFPIIMLGYLANNFLPARLGDVVMAYLMGIRQKVSKSAALATIVLDRILDVVTLFSFLLISLYLHQAPRWVKSIVMATFLLLCIGLTMAWFIAAQKVRSERVMRFFLRVLPGWIEERVMQFFVLFSDGLAVLRYPALILKAYLTSLVIWGLLGIGVYFLFMAFSFDLGLSRSFMVLGIVNLGLIIPSAPGSIGTFQFFCVAALGLFSIGESSAFGFSVVYHVSQYLPTTLVGWYYLQRENLNLGRLRERSVRV